VNVYEALRDLFEIALVVALMLLYAEQKTDWRRKGR
jgi:hypothetical protein